MSKLRATVSHGVGSSITKDVFRNHYVEANVPSEVKAKIASMGLERVAGNMFICESSQDFWTVKNGAIVRLVGGEVDNGEKLSAAPEESPMNFLNAIMSDLEF